MGLLRLMFHAAIYRSVSVKGKVAALLFTIAWGGIGTVYLVSEYPLHGYITGIAWAGLGGLVIMWTRVLYFATQWKELEAEKERQILHKVGELPTDEDLNFLNRHK